MNSHQRIFRWVLIGVWSVMLGSVLLYTSTLKAQVHPSVSIVDPGDGATVDGPVTLRIEHRGLRFDGIQVGRTPEPDVGHWHVHIDGKLAGLSSTGVIELPNDHYPTISAGKHTITVSLNENNHDPLKIPIEDSIELNFSRQVSKPTALEGAPKLTLLEPGDGATISDPFLVRITHSGVRFDGVGASQDPEPRVGHWHVNIDGKFAGMAVSDVIAIPNDSFPTLTAGDHTLTIYIHQNNHVVTSPPFAQSIQIRVTREVSTNAATGGVVPSLIDTPTVDLSSVQTTTSEGPGELVATVSQEQTTTLAGAASPTAESTTNTATPRRTASPTATSNRTAVRTAVRTALPSTTSITVAGFPNTGGSGIDVTLPMVTAIICLLLGGLLLHSSRLNRWSTVTAGGAWARSSRPPLLLPSPHPVIDVEPRAQRLRLRLPRPVVPWRFVLAFVAGAFFSASVTAVTFVLYINSTQAVAVPRPATQALVAPTAVIAQPVGGAPAVAAPTAAPVVAPTAVAVAGGVQPSAPRVQPAARPAPVNAPSLPWPARLPLGMSFSPADSWPFQVVSDSQMDDPFLIFRDGERWLTLRAQDDQAEPLPLSAGVQTVQVGAQQATLIKYHGMGFKLNWNHGGQALQLSGAGLTDDEIIRTATSLHRLDPHALRSRLTLAAAHQQFNVSIVWPNYLPGAMALSLAETSVELGLPGVMPRTDEYLVTYKDGETKLQIGGGTAVAPIVNGVEERITTATLSGRLISGEGKHVLLIDAADPQPGAQQRVEARPDTSRLVQRGPVFVAAEHMDRAEFDRIIAGLSTVRAPEFISRAHGRHIYAERYMWPSWLPKGYAIDPGSVRYAWDDYVLQGGRTFFELSALGPNGDAVTIRGGANRQGEALAMLEGADIEYSFPVLRGQTATAARAADGTTVMWTEEGITFAINSPTLAVEQLAAIADKLRLVDRREFFNVVASVSETNANTQRHDPASLPAGSRRAAVEVGFTASAPLAMSPLVQARLVGAVAPKTLIISKIGLDTPVYAVGPDATGNLVVPTHDVGWYQASGKPGESAKMIFWGHVLRWKATPHIPAPFADLHLLNPGDTISVINERNQRFDYVVTEQFEVGKDEISYMEPSSEEQVMLITCSGDNIYVNGELNKTHRLLTIARPANAAAAAVQP